jgi:tellurite resistance protein TehA-like permease
MEFQAKLPPSLSGNVFGCFENVFEIIKVLSEVIFSVV